MQQSLTNGSVGRLSTSGGALTLRTFWLKLCYPWDILPFTMDLKCYLQDKNRIEFADLIGTSYGYLRLLVCNVRRPSPELAARISAATNGEVTIEELLFPYGIPEESKFSTPNQEAVNS
jgi:hypothetical protein